MKRILSLILALSVIFACNPTEPEQKVEKLSLSISCEPESAYDGVDVQWTSTVTGGKTPYTYAWDFGGDDLTSTEANPKVQFLSAGVKLIKLTVTDDLGNTVSKSKTFKVEAAPVVDKGDIKVEWVKTSGKASTKVRGSSPAVANDGTAYIVLSLGQDHCVYAFKDGNLVKSAQISADGSNGCGSPSIDADGNVYAYAGSGGSGAFKKFSADLTAQWSAKFWAKGDGTPAPKMWYGYPIVIGDNVLVSNAGTTGTTGFVSKADGTRVSYMTSGEGGGPSGGCRQAPAVSKSGEVWQVCAANGIAHTTVKALSNPGGVAYDWMYNEIGGNTLKSSTDSPECAVVTADGKDWLARCFTPEGLNARIVLVDATGETCKLFEIDEINTSAKCTASQDQGGVIVGAQNEVVVNLKSTGAGLDGGIVALNPSTMQLAWEYRIGEDVTGAAALTKEGNVVFGTDKGSFFVVKPDYTTKKASLVAKANVNDLVRTALSGTEAMNIKMWSSVTVGDDGKMYIGFTKEDGEINEAGMLCLSASSVTGAGTSAWPMYGVDRKHSGVQK